MRALCLCIFVSSLVWSQSPIQTNPAGFQLIQGSLTSPGLIQQLGTFSPDWAKLGKISRDQGQDLRVKTHLEYGTPRLILGKLTQPSTDSPAEIATRFLQSHRTMLKMKQEDEWVLRGTHTDDLGHGHATFSLFHNGLEVWPSELRIHMDPSGRIDMLNGIYRSPNLPEAPHFKSSKTYQNLIAGDLGRQRSDLNFDMQAIIYDWHVVQPQPALLVTVTSPHDLLLNRLYILSTDGAIINTIDQTCSGQAKSATNCTVYPTLDKSQTASVSGYNDNGNIFLINTSKQMYPGQLDPNTLAGTIYVLEANHTSEGTGYAKDPNGDTVFNDTDNTHAAGAASYLVSTTYDWLLNTFNRNSWDGNGSSFRVFVNFRNDPNQGLDNAFWTGKELVFGDGGQITRNWAFALDFATHEVCHAITSSSANLVYQFQSGALNESFSDMYGTTQDARNWTIGEDITIAEVYGAPGLRDMSDPHQGKATGDYNHGWQPNHMNEFQNLAANQDSGGVHINSGIPNHAYYQLATAIGRDKAIQIMHRTLTQYLTRNSEFADFRTSAEKAAADIHGQGSAEQTAVSGACAAVGIGEATTTPGASSNTLYMPFAAPFDFYGLSYGSTFYISNITGETVTGKATWYDASGQVTSAFDLTAAAHTTLIGQSSANDQWVKIETNGQLVGTYHHMTSDGSSWSMIPATPFVNNGLFIPHVATNTQKFWTVGALANVVDTPSSLLYVDNFDTGWTVEANQVGKALAFDFEGLYGTYPDVSGVGGLWGFFLNFDRNTSKVLEQNVVGAEVFGRKDANMAAGLIVDASSGRTLLFTHVAANTQTFWTGYSVVNMTAETAHVQINCYDGNGQLLAGPGNVASIAPYGKLLQVTGAGSFVPVGTSWFSVTGLSETSVLSGMELFGSQDDRQLAGFQASPFVSKSFYFPFVISGSGNRPGTFASLNPSWTGISVINPNDVTVNVTIKLYRNDGQVISGTATIKPYNKLLGTIKSLFNVTDFYGYAEITSSLPVAGFSLSGFEDQREMAANPMVFTR